MLKQIAQKLIDQSSQAESPPSSNHAPGNLSVNRHIPAVRVVMTTHRNIPAVCSVILRCKACFRLFAFNLWMKIYKAVEIEARSMKECYER